MVTPSRSRRPSCRVAVLQSNYLPWKGYFDLIDCVDVFVVLDTVQFTKNDWRNRNKIRTRVAGTPDATAWISIPVLTAGRFGQPIRATEIDATSNWAHRHLARIEQEYRSAAFAEDGIPWIRDVLAEVAGLRLLSHVNRTLIERVCDRLAISTPVVDAATLPDAEDPTDRLVGICHELGATTYVSGPAARSYLDVSRFEAVGAEVEWFDYEGYPRYEQVAQPFIPAVSVIDTILNTGEQARSMVVRGRGRPS